MSPTIDMYVPNHEMLGCRDQPDTTERTMTQLAHIDVTCPKCSESDTAEVWTSINSSTNPDEAQYLIDGFLFSWTCPACGHTATLNYDCLYHDPARKLMIQYIANAATNADAHGGTTANAKTAANVANAASNTEADTKSRVTTGTDASVSTTANAETVTSEQRAKQAADALAPLRDKGYEVRIVASRESLREKAAIARDGLDDRAIELLKFLLFNKFVGEGVLDGNCAAYYGALDEDGNIIVEFVGAGEPQESTIPRDVYETAAGQIPQLGHELLSAFSIDRSWASKANGQLGK